MESFELYLRYKQWDSSSIHIVDGDELSKERPAYNNEEEWWKSDGVRIPLRGITEVDEGIYMASVDIKSRDYCIDDVVVSLFYEQLTTYGVFNNNRTIIIPFYYSKIEYNKERGIFYCYKLDTNKQISIQEPERNYVVHKRNLIGQLLLDLDGEEIIVSKDYDDYRRFSDDMCAVHRGQFILGSLEKSWGFVDNTGAEVIPCRCSHVSDSQNGFAIEYESIGHGLSSPVCIINKKGSVVFKEEMIMAKPFNNGLALVQLFRGRYGWNYVKEDGGLLFRRNVESATEFHNGTAEIVIAKESKSKRTINQKGQFLFHENGEELWLSIDTSVICDFREFHDGFCVVVSHNGDCGLINRKGEIVLDLVYRSVSDYYNGVAKVVWKDGQESEIDANQHFIVRISESKITLHESYQFAYALTDSLIAVVANNQFGVVDSRGEAVLPCVFQSVWCSNDIIRVCDSYGDVVEYDLRGSVIYPENIKEKCIRNQFEIVKQLTPRFFCARKAGKWALLDDSGHPITDFNYCSNMDVIYKEENNSKECILLVAEIKERGRVRYGLISSDGQELLKCEYCFENLFFKDDLGKDNENSIKDIANYRFISRDGYEEEEFDRYAHNGISSSNWGVFSLKQKRIIIDGYNCIYRLDNYFVAGRNGHFLKEGHDGGHIEGYSGVYDLFSLEGELLIGGFSAIQTVGSWIILTYDVAWEEDDDYNYCTFRKVFHSATKWLIIDSDLHLLSSELLGSSSSIELGTIISISETKGEKGVRIHKYNYPTRLFFNKEPLVYNKYFIVSINNTNYFLSTNSVAISKGYAQIQLLGNSLYFTTDSGDKTSTIGVFDADHFCSIVEGCLAITKPVGVFFFSIHKLENGYCRVTLHNISSSTSTTVIEQISVIGLRELLNNSKLLIINESNQKLEEGIAVLDSSVFDKGVETKFRRTDSFVAKSTEYWISIDPNLCFVPAEEEQKEDDECYPDSSDNLITAYDNPYYDEGLDMDQQSDSFWEEF